MKRRELLRISLVPVVGTPVLSPLPATPAAPSTREIPDDYDASRRLAREDWKPSFLTPHQVETVATLSDMIIPDSETPGGRGALVHRFIDHLLAAAPPGMQRDFLASLAFLDGESRQRLGDAFVHLASEDRSELLLFLAYPHRLVTWGGNRSEYPGHAHFNRLKDWISRAYYGSEVGLKELGWDEAPMHGPYEGCAHESGGHPGGE